MTMNLHTFVELGQREICKHISSRSFSYNKTRTFAFWSNRTSYSAPQSINQ